MKLGGFTKQERAFIALMRIWAIAFLGTGVIFALSPEYIPNYLTRIGNGIFGWSSPFLNFGDEHFWLVLAVALLFTLSYVCVISQHNLVHNIGYARPVIMAKLVSSIGFGVCFFASGEQFVYLVAAIVDGFICLITWRFYISALKSRA